MDIVKSNDYRTFICPDEICRVLEGVGLMNNTVDCDTDGNSNKKSGSFMKNILQNVSESGDALKLKLRMSSSPSFENNKQSVTPARKNVSEIPLSETIEETAEGLSPTNLVVDIFQELFDLKEKTNWLRRNAVVILIQQIFGGTVDRKISENLKWLAGEEHISRRVLIYSHSLNWFNSLII